MFKSIGWKILTMFVLLTLAVMIFVGVYSISGITAYYHNAFQTDMRSYAFTEEVVEELTKSTTSGDPLQALIERLNVYSVRIGVDSYRNYYILDGKTGACLAGGSGELLPPNYEITPNILSAMAGKDGTAVDSNASFMDYAVPIKDDSAVRYIIYVTDTKDEMRDVIKNIFQNVLVALLFGLAISVCLGIVLSRTILAPIADLQTKAQRLAAGNFNYKIEVRSNDEIGRLTEAFNEMASDLKDTLEQVAGEKNKIETILQYMTDGIIAFNPDGTVMHINPAARKLLGLEGDIVFDTYFPSIGVELTMGQLLYIERETSVVEREISIGDRHINAFFTPFQGEPDKAEGVMVLLHDMTKQQKLEESRREFVANVSHELRTPLATIKSYAETLIDSAEPGEEAFRISFLKTIDTEADRMTRIVQDLLTLSKLNSTQGLVKEKFDLAALVQNAVRKQAFRIEEKNQQVQVASAEGMPLFYGDKGRIEQVVLNVLTNAVKYTPKGGAIRVECGYQFTHVYLRVTDNGIGIPKEDLTRVFERFYRVDKARSREEGGTGLGLAIAKEIVEAHNGEISIASELRKGTEVCITMPIYSE